MFAFPPHLYPLPGGERKLFIVSFLSSPVSLSRGEREAEHSVEQGRPLLQLRISSRMIPVEFTRFLSPTPPTQAEACGYKPPLLFISPKASPLQQNLSILRHKSLVVCPPDSLHSPLRTFRLPFFRQLSLR
jgi:hypothetical protein